MVDMVFIPERLKEIREERNLSKAAAARLLNLSKMGYLRYETGDRTPSYQTIVFMAQKLGTSPEYLTGKESDLSPSTAHRRNSSHEVSCIPEVKLRSDFFIDATAPFYS